MPRHLSAEGQIMGVVKTWFANRFDGSSGEYRRLNSSMYCGHRVRFNLSLKPRIAVRSSELREWVSASLFTWVSMVWRFAFNSSWWRNRLSGAYTGRDFVMRSNTVSEITACRGNFRGAY